MLIEDNPGDVELIVDLFNQRETESIELHTAETLTEGLETLANANIDCVLLDLHLPDSDGLDTFTQLQKHHPDVAVVVLTGLHDDDLAAEAVRQGAQDFLEKGEFEYSLLRRTLRYALERQQTQQALQHSEEKLRTIVQKLNDIIFIIDADSGEILDTNPAIKSTLGYDAETIIGTSIFSLIDNTPGNTTPQAHHFFLETPPPTSYQLRRIDGSICLMDLKTTAIVWENQLAILLTLRDITEREQAETALRLSEARQRAILNVIPDFMLRLNGEGIILDYSQADGIHIFPAHIDPLGQHLAEILTPNLLWPLQHSIDRVLTLGDLQVFEFRQVFEGQTSDYEARVVQGGENEVLAIIRDITHRKKAEEALRESEERFRQVVTSISAHIYVTEIDAVGNRRNIYISHQAEQMTGYTIDHFLDNWHFWAENVIHPDDRSTARSQASKNAAGINSEVEYRLIHSSGRIVWVRDSARVHRRGTIKMVYGLISDITERKRTEVELQNYREQLENLVQARTQALEDAMSQISEARDRIDAILNSMADGLIVTDLAHRIILTNPAAEILLNIPMSQMLNQPIEQIISNTALNDIIEAMLTTLDSRHSPNQQAVDVELAAPGERPKVLRTRTTPVDTQDGHILGAVTIIQDVTHEREVDRLKTEFVTTAAHELRTPLTTVQGFSEILLARDLSEERRVRYLNLINQQANHLVEIINDLLDISRLEAGRGLEIKPNPLELGTLIEEVVQPFTETELNHIIQLENLDTLPTLYGDPFRLGQVVRNLLSNAIKYSPEGGEILISGKVINDQIEIQVQDHGIGMTHEQLTSLFQKFYRADASNTSISGTGLGLAICKVIIELHGGEIWAQSEYGVGTRLHFTLPLNAEQDSPSSPEPDYETYPSR